MIHRHSIGKNSGSGFQILHPITLMVTFYHENKRYPPAVDVMPIFTLNTHVRFASPVHQFMSIGMTLQEVGLWKHAERRLSSACMTTISLVQRLKEISQ